MGPVATFLIPLLAFGLLVMLLIHLLRAKAANRRLTGQLRMMAQLTGLHKNASQDDDVPFLEAIAAHAVNVFGGSATTIHEWNPSNSQFLLAVNHAFSADCAATLAAWTVSEGLSTVVSDLQPACTMLDPQGSVPLAAAYRAGYRALWAAPIMRDGHLLGMICVWHEQPRFPSPQDEDLLRLLACQAGASFERDALLQAGVQRAQALALLHVVADLCTRGLALSALLKRVAKEIEYVTNADLVGILLFNESRKQLEMPVLHGRLAEKVEGQPDASHGVLNWVLTHGESALLHDVSADSRHVETTSGIASELCVPLKVRDKVIGLINLESRQPCAFSEETQQLLLTLGAQLAATLENQALVERERSRAQQLFTVTEIAQDVVAILNVDLLLDRVVNLVRKRFGFYDVNVLLVDDTQEYLLWQTGTRLSAEMPMLSLRNPLSRGITGWVVRNRQPLMVGDVSKDPRYVAVSQLSGTRSELAVPIALGDQVLGVLDVQSDRLDAYTENDVFVLQTLANLVAIALGNARSFEQAQQRVAELMALRQVSLLLISETNLSKVLETIAASALQLVGASEIEIHLYDARRDTFAFGTALGQGGINGPGQNVDKNGLLRAAIGQTEPLVIDDISTHPDFWDQDFSDTKLISVACFPLIRGESVLGVLSIAFARLHNFGEDELRVLELLADQAALSLERAQLFEELNRRVQELRTMTQVGQVVATTLDLDRICERIISQVMAAIPAEAGAVFITQDEGFRVKGCTSGAVNDLELGQAPRQSVAWEVLTSGQPVLVPDIGMDQRFDGHATIVPEAKARSVLCVPMLSKDRIIGGLELVNKRGTPFGQDDLDLLSAIATSATAAIENARLYQERGRRLAETTVLCEMAQQTTSSLAFDQVLDAIVQQLRTVIACRAISLFLLDESTDELVIWASSGLKPEFRDRARIKIGEGVSGLAFKEARPLHIRDVKKEQPHLGLDPTVNSLLVVPLIAKSRVIGTLSVDSTKRNAFTTAQERLLTIVAAQAASAIENAQLFAAERQRAEELRQAYEELQQLDRLKSQFVQNISHELRTPLTFVKGYADLLVDEAMGPLDPEQKRSVDIIATKTEAIIHLVNDIITLQEIESAPTNKEMSSLGDIVSMVVDTARATAHAAGLEMNVCLPEIKMWVLADEDRLIQVFDNLLGNAIKFSPNGGSIDIAVGDDGHGNWRVSIADHGIGIPEDKLEKVFERFYQVDGSTTRRFGGTGLGLAIAKEIIMNHEGEIWAESQLGQGSTFYVCLPKYVDDQILA